MNDKTVSRIIIGVTIAIPVAVTTLHFLPKPDQNHVPDLIKHCPLLNAILNGTCTVLLICSYIAIRNKKVNIHKTLNMTAFTLSALFLLSYVAYHSFAKETHYPDGPVRPVYLTILYSHIILAAVVLPMVLLSFYRGLTNQIVKHRKLARWTMPIWLYVTITGVVVYLMISPYYTF
jgi:putative membrane protein